MKKIVWGMLLVLLATPSFAQDQEEETPQGWRNSGNFSLMFNQAAFNTDWLGGGVSSIVGNLQVDYNITYEKERFTWANNFLGEYGLTRQKGEDFNRKTSDRLEINSVLGYRITEDSKWSYTFFADFKTQWDRGYEYNEDDKTREEITRFMSPGYLKFGPGIMYKDEEKLQVNFAPATSRFIFVNDRFTTAPDYEDESYYGMKAGKSMRYEFGASLDALSTIQLFENVDLKQKLSLFSDYLDKPGNIDVDYTVQLDMKINKFLSANVLFQAIYEDKAISAFQIREMIGVGLSHKL